MSKFNTQVIFCRRKAQLLGRPLKFQPQQLDRKIFLSGFFYRFDGRLLERKSGTTSGFYSNPEPIETDETRNEDEHHGPDDRNAGEIFKQFGGQFFFTLTFLSKLS